jgi:hypothetical protein
MSLRPLVIAFLVILLSGSLQAQRGALVNQRNLTDLTERAERIVHAHVISAKVEAHPGYPALSTVVVTLHVDDTLKGAPAQQLTFRQFIWDWRDKQDAAGYRKGRELLLFLNKPNAEGLTSPSGMDQGRLDVFHAPDGRGMVQPKSAARTFLAGVDASLAKRGKTLPISMRVAMLDPSRSIELADMKAVVRELAGSRSTQ